MSTPSNSKKPLIVTGIAIAKMIGNKIMRQQHSFVITPTSCYYLVDGTKVNEHCFELMFPIKMESVNNPNLDSRSLS